MDHARNRELLRSAAEQGHLLAMIQLGVDLHSQATSESLGAVIARHHGREGGALSRQSKRHGEEALEWLARAMQEKNPYAYSKLASFYGHGAAGAPRALPLDLALQTKYTRIAAEQGEVWSQHYLGIRLLSGIGVEKDVEAAKRWLLLAGKQQAVFGHYPVTASRKKMKELQGDIDDSEWPRGEACSHVAAR